MTGPEGAAGFVAVLLTVTVQDEAVPASIGALQAMLVLVRLTTSTEMLMVRARVPLFAVSAIV